MKNFYEILEVDRNASKDVIDKAYRVLAKKYHPDTNTASNKDWAEENFKKINEAYETLSDNHKREEYDKKLDYTSQQANKNTEIVNDLLEENKRLKNQINNIAIEYQNMQNNVYSNINNDNIQNNYNSYYQEPNNQEYYYYKKPNLLRRILNTERKRTIFAVIVTIIFFEGICRLLLLSPKFKSLVLTQYYTGKSFKFVIYILNLLLFKPLNLD